MTSTFRLCGHKYYDVDIPSGTKHFAKLVEEPENSVDKNAIKVASLSESKTLGYVPKKQTYLYKRIGLENILYVIVIGKTHKVDDKNIIYYDVDVLFKP